MKYKVIYADPPWQYKDKCHAGKRGAEYKYSCLSVEELMRLRVIDIADDDCALFLWSTCPMLPVALNVMSKWGFVYKTIAFFWIKTNKRSTIVCPTLFWGMGNWTRANGEVCLIGIRGKPRRIRRDVHQIIVRPIMKHSKKPPETRNRIECLMGDVPRIELFARERSHGWHAWGDEIENSDWECSNE